MLFTLMAIHRSALVIGFEFAVPPFLVDLNDQNMRHMRLIVRISDRYYHHSAKHGCDGICSIMAN
jgi:hypothetical protein